MMMIMIVVVAMIITVGGDTVTARAMCALFFVKNSKIYLLEPNLIDIYTLHSSPLFSLLFVSIPRGTPPVDWHD